MKSDEKAEEIYQKFFTDKQLFDGLVYYIKNRQFPNACVIIREYTYSNYGFIKKIFKLKKSIRKHIYLN